MSSNSVAERCEMPCGARATACPGGEQRAVQRSRARSASMKTIPVWLLELKIPACSPGIPWHECAGPAQGYRRDRWPPPARCRPVKPEAAIKRQDPGHALGPDHGPVSLDIDPGQVGLAAQYPSGEQQPEARATTAQPKSATHPIGLIAYHPPLIEATHNERGLNAP